MLKFKIEDGGDWYSSFSQEFTITLLDNDIVKCIFNLSSTQMSCGIKEISGINSLLNFCSESNYRLEGIIKKVTETINNKFNYNDKEKYTCLQYAFIVMSTTSKTITKYKKVLDKEQNITIGEEIENPNSGSRIRILTYKNV